MRRSRLARLGLNLANLLVIGFFLLPIVTAAIGSLQSEKTLRADTRAVLPREWTLDNFRVFLSGGAQSAGSIYEQATYLPDNVKKIYYALGNSVVIAGSVTLLTLVFAALSAYAAVRLRLRWLAWLMELSVLARFVPIIVLIIPLYVTFRRLELLNSMWGVIIAEVGFLLPYGILILAPYFAALPQELDEAARIDGASPAQVYFRIYLPLMAPALVAVGTYALLLAWNEYLYQFLLLSSKQSMTVPVALAQFLNSDEAPWNYMMATAIVYALPPVAIYYAFRRRMTAGLTMGGIKG